MQTFEKTLTANDTGETGGHQAGIHIPKSQTELIAFLPPLDPSIKNPDIWLEMTDEASNVWRFRFIFYNNKHHDVGGTRDEFRITHMTKYFRVAGAREGDVLVLSGIPGSTSHSISIRRSNHSGPADDAPARIRLQGWRRVY